MKRFVYTAACLLTALVTSAQTPTCDSAQYLFKTYDSYKVPYRIPGIATTRKGHLIALCDRRYCGADIGFGKIDIVARTSRDNGRTWGPDTVVQRGSGIEGADNCGYGDVAVVADRTSNRILCMSVTGNVAYFRATRQQPNRIARWYSNDGGKSWTAAEDVTDQFYGLGQYEGRGLFPNTETMFIGSGRICQSRLVKKGKYYRVYCSVLTMTGPERKACNYVIYSDDLGQTWEVLGSPQRTVEDSPCVGGDEPKCEELPNGDVVLSSRKWYGRYFNVYHFDHFATDQKAGSWGTCVASHDVQGGIKVGANSCNGEIMLIDAREVGTKRPVKLMLQSLPCGDQRTRVGFWFKEIIPNGIYSPRAFAAAWTKGLEVSAINSAYSTMTLQKDGRIGFFYEEEPNDYSMVYVPLSIAQITGGKYQ